MAAGSVVMSADFAEGLTLILGQPESFAASILIYTIVGIIFLRIFEGVISIISLLIRKV